MNRLLEGDRIFYVLAVILLIPSLFIGLGTMPLVSDEGIRALVAIEMQFEGNLFTPTINGSYYYNKPPLYNWAILAVFNLFDSNSLFVFRLFNVFAGLAFGLVTYFFARLEFNKRQSLLIALLLLTCGRILFNDLFLGLIALTHSTILFLNFYVIYVFGSKQKYGWLFSISYILIAITFLMKGFQGIAAQAISLPVYFLLKRDFKRLFSIQHIAGILLFAIIVAIYFYIYYSFNEANFSKYIRTLWDQSEQRTFSHYAILDVILHFVIYPIKLLYEILPYGFLVLMFWRKDVVKHIHTNEFLLFAAAMLIANNVIYMLSPFWHARYVFFLFPFIFILFMGFIRSDEFKNSKPEKILNTLWFWLAVITAATLVILPFLPFTKNLPHIEGYSILFALAVSGICYLMIRFQQSRLILFVLVMVVARYAADVIFIPLYSDSIKESRHREKAIQVGEYTKGKTVWLLYDMFLTQDISFYIARERQEILKREYDFVNQHDLYIISSDQTEELRQKKRKYDVHYTFNTRNEQDTLFLVKFETPFPLPGKKVSNQNVKN